MKPIDIGGRYSLDSHVKGAAAAGHKKAMDGKRKHVVAELDDLKATKVHMETPDGHHWTWQMTFLLMERETALHSDQEFSAKVSNHKAWRLGWRCASDKW